MNNFRLNPQIQPQHYKLDLDLDVAQATFVGSVEVTITAEKPTQELVLHCLDLEISEASIADNDARVEIDSWAIDTTSETVKFQLTKPLEPETALTLALTFSGSFNSKLVGIYLSTFKDEEGNEQRIASTQFEAPHARRAFPCFDEPAFKATYEISLTADSELEAISNGRKLETAEASHGRTKHKFATTVPLSTYLIAFVVGPLEISDPIDVRGIEVRIAYRPGREGLDAFAKRVAEFSLSYLTDYFDIKYQGDKIDLIALPDFEMGAMENHGCITFRETALLADESRATQPELERTADVIAHELAHMWFGNLVTMKWWHGLWLNEAFATFAEMKVVDAMFPEWDRWGSFMRSRSAAFETDATSSTRPIEFNVESPAEAEAMFDILTYEKGASLVRMLEQYVGEEAFRDGLRHYMETFKFSNTDTPDLWSSIDSTTNGAASAMMESWIFTPGFPSLECVIIEDKLTVSQNRIDLEGANASDGNPSWVVPLSYKVVDGENSTVSKALLDNKSVEIDLTGVNYDCVVVNAGGDAFARVIYSEEMLADCAGNLSSLTHIERYNLIDDAWYSVKAGRSSAGAFLNLLESFSAEESRIVLGRIITGLYDLSELLTESQLDDFSYIVTDLLRPALIRIGMAPAEEEDQSLRQLRGELISTLGILGQDPEVQAEAERTLSVLVRDPELVEPSIGAAAISIVARIGDESDFDQFVDSWKSASTPQEEQRFLGALPRFKQPELLDRFFDLILEKKIKSQTGPFLLRAGLASRSNRNATWEFIKDNWAFLTDYFGDASLIRMVDGVTNLNASSEEVAQVQKFLTDANLRVGGKTLEQIFERQSVALSLRERESDRFSQLTKQKD